MLMFYGHNIARAQDIITNSFFINPDIASASMGHTALAFGTPMLFFYNPSANFAVFDRTVSGSFFQTRDTGGIVLSYVMPTNVGIFGVGVGHAFLDNNTLRNAGFRYRANSLHLNFVYPLVSTVPVTTTMGGVGISAKIFNIHAFDDSSIAAVFDLGITYSLSRFVRGLWGGAAFRNIGSNISLAGQTFESPSNFSLFSRYEFNDTHNSAINLDIIKSLNSSSLGVALGGEISPVYPLTIRAGYRDFGNNVNAGPTAGFSINLNALSLGYAFSLVQSGSQSLHLIGLNVSLGRIANERRAYEHFLGVHFDQARASFRAGDYIASRAHFENILAIYPDHAPSQGYLRRIAQAMESLDRSFAVKIERLLRRADVASLRNDFVRARRYYSLVLSADPENQQALFGIEDIDARVDAVRQEQAFLQREAEISSIWNRAMGYFNSGRFIFARQQFEQVLAIDPHHRPARDYIARANEQIGITVAYNAEELFQQAMAYYNRADFDRAARFFDTAFLTDPSRLDARDMAILAARAAQTENIDENLDIHFVPFYMQNEDVPLTTTQQIAMQMNSAFADAQDLFNAGDYNNALAAFVRLREMSVRNSFFDLNTRIRQYTTRSRNAISDRLFNEAVILSRQQNNPDEAFVLLTRALEYNSENVGARRERETVAQTLAQRYYDEGIQYFTRGNIARARESMLRSLELNPNKPEARRALDRINRQGDR